MHLPLSFPLSPLPPPAKKKKKVVAQRGEPNAVSPPALMILTTLDSQVILLEIEDFVAHYQLNKIWTLFVDVTSNITIK